MLLTIEQAAQEIINGKVVACPTESVYGLSCDPMNQQAVSSIWKLKQRPESMGLIVVGSSWAQLKSYMADLSIDQQRILQESWPNAITWIVPASDMVPHWIRGNRNTVALRWTAHPVLASLCQKLDYGLISTSANLHGNPPALSIPSLTQEFANKSGFSGIVSGDLGGHHRPTAIRELLTGAWIRE